MMTGRMTYTAQVLNIDGVYVPHEVTRPCEIHSIADGLVTFRPGTICKKGSYPNIHKYLNTKGSETITLPVTECVFTEANLF